MPRAFTETEKQTIRGKLMAAGRACFLRYGLKKTTIDDLVKPAGIAKASFYLFFKHKEALFVEIMMEEMPAMMRRLLDGSFDGTDDTREALVLLIKGIAGEIQANEFSRIMLDDPSELQRLAASLDVDDILHRSLSFFRPLTERVIEAQARGEIVAGDPRQILYSLGLIKLVALNRDKMPTELYESMMEFVPELLANGLTYGCHPHDVGEAEPLQAGGEAKRREP
ncbi:TetR/AcrR family transcriptional regulator [Candidatus Bipolaricaulota bacterium]|nr:TetR/AcrR family transcriptional regulator [Candidatus Bipolaricaulota bacterium]